MAGKWAELAKRTGQSVHEANSTLEAFLKPLLHPDPAQRPTLSAMLIHPYLQYAGPIKPPLTSEPVQMSAVLPSMLSVRPSLQAPALLLPEMGAWSDLEAVPGMVSVFWAPKSHYLYATLPGNVFRCAHAVCELAHPRTVRCICVSKSSILCPKQGEEKIMSFGVNLMTSQVICQAPQVLSPKHLNGQCYVRQSSQCQGSH